MGVQAVKCWLIAGALLATALPAFADWQSRDSNYNQNIVAAGGSYTGPGDVVSGAKMWWGLRAYSLATVGTKAANICNSGDANCADVNTLSNGDFDVATATGAPLNCGGAGGTCTIKVLYDKIGINCAAANCDLTQTTIANRPTLVFNCVGTKPCASFNGTSQRIISGGSATSVSQPVTLSAVAINNNTGAQRSILFFAGNTLQIAYSSANNAQLFAGSNRGAAASTSAFHALQGVANGASSDINIDGTANTGTAGSNALSGTISMGDNGGSSQWFNGGITEAGASPSAFSSGQSSSMSSNQHSYWGF